MSSDWSPRNWVVAAGKTPLHATLMDGTPESLSAGTSRRTMFDIAHNDNHNPTASSPGNAITISGRRGRRQRPRPRDANDDQRIHRAGPGRSDRARPRVDG